ncbi:MULTISPECIES: alanine--tRNA ligase [unclassified Lentimonas]|uniref:alanine--tRNA ligase n=1 Tax=unclassified Lentimonas TaxID=2630993 RepID=UPI001323E558|nr:MULTISPECIES: alanine--tRNA ligase [unclassified Lentimonas]CAA6678824.1 Alanyl-tRNA synthetase (EC [Lentimonas sp. CC4]CAA6684428.1 Alanyl-tRNA synthetase (EC [Lentimonas sp. CC6]CAA7077493.1 Alanyl-tRNA synthetase (EC [Lentimonas sp. CC4]CAA7171327.1 Alanyl-tRNA synthetase (EC [Lentimonas sp. CC21]CAA7183357.1 Alanyl-tRNA synthetase (EC [Lentimonas sp. CC8]
MKSSEIRQSFLDFFASKQHTPVPSASLMPQSPGLLFTNAGMNQFVPYFLGTEKAPYSPPRAADTQKCIRAGGKHNDLEDVGYDTYHHTFFEMLGNWSFGDYFKKEAIAWGWELIVDVWGVPAERLYATVYAPSEGDPSSFDQEAYDLWAKHFESKGLDPKKHIINGNVKDNFWMMGETGPCGPCSELHVDLTPNGDSEGKLVNMDSDLCIEIWNLVFIQYNAEADGTFRDLPAKHVDTGMGFERACSLIQNTKGFTDFSEKPTNYATDVFQPIFRTLEKLSGKTYKDIYPESVESDKSKLSTEMKEAIAFRVIADHIRTLSFSLADGILLGNTGRNYVLRRILRRAVRYGRTLGFSSQQTFLPELVDTLVEEFGAVFPELKKRADAIKENLQREEASFNETLDRGLTMFEQEIADGKKQLCGEFAFKLYDTFGFPIDLTQLLCAERGLKVDMQTFEKHMEAQRNRARKARTQQLVRAADIATDAHTDFTGFEEDESSAKVLEIHKQDDALLVITDRTPFYAEMGGQLGDQGTLTVNGTEYPVSAVQQLSAARAHSLPLDAQVAVGDAVSLRLDPTRRRPIEAHHTATHLLHTALHELISTDAAQQGSMVSRTRLRFDFNSGALTQDQIDAIELKVNACIEAGEPVSWKEVPHADIKDRKDIQQFFGDKYGDLVRVVQIGGQREQLDGDSMELCGGTHVRNTKEIGLFKIKSEGAIASGIRRIEALCGTAAYDWVRSVVEKSVAEEKELRAKLEASNKQLVALDAEAIQFPEMPHVMSGMLAEGNFEQKNKVFKDILANVQGLKAATVDADKAVKKAQAAGAAKIATALIAEQDLEGNLVLNAEGPAALLQELLNGLKGRQFANAAFCIVDDGEKLYLGALCGATAKSAGLIAGKLIQTLAPIAGGKGGGKPDMARGAASDRAKISELEAEAKKTLGA